MRTGLCRNLPDAATVSGVLPIGLLLLLRRSRARSAAAIGGVNPALLSAWLIPDTTAPIAAASGLTSA